MTTPAPVSGFRDWFGRWLGRLMIVCAIGTCLNFAGLAAALILISRQAGSGADARERQQLVYPVSLKLYEDAAKRPAVGRPGFVITQQDLACFKSSQKCPRRTTR